MDEKQADEAGQSAQQETIDPVQLQYALQRLRVEQNLAGGIVAGLVAAVIGIAIYEGYRLSFREVSQDEMTRLLKGSAAGSAPY